MPLDPKLLTQIIGGVGGALGGGGNGFLKGWQRAEQEMQGRRQQESEQQRQQQQMALQTEQAERLKQQAAQQAAQLRMTAFGKATDLLNDPGIYTPEEYERRATLARNMLADPSLGFAPGFLDTALPPAPQPTVFQSRIAAKKLAEIQNTPQVKKLIASGQSLDSTTWKVPELGEQPVSFAQLQQLAGGPTPAAPLPSAEPDKRGFQRVEAMLDGKPVFVMFDPDSGKYTDAAGQDVSSKVTPMPPDRVVYPPPQGVGVGDYRSFLMTTKLQGDWLKASESIREMNRQFMLMQTGLKRFRQGDKNGGSQAVLVTFQKILDPTSVVRESEYARTATGQSLINRIEGFTEKLASGGAGMTDAELAAMVETARQFLDGMQQYSNAQRSKIGRTAGAFGVAPELIFSDDAAPAEQAAPPSGRATVAPPARSGGPAPATPNANPFRR